MAVAVGLLCTPLSLFLSFSVCLSLSLSVCLSLSVSLSVFNVLDPLGIVRSRHPFDAAIKNIPVTCCDAICSHWSKKPEAHSAGFRLLWSPPERALGFLLQWATAEKCSVFARWHYDTWSQCISHFPFSVFYHSSHGGKHSMEVK